VVAETPDSFKPFRSSSTAASALPQDKAKPTLPSASSALLKLPADKPPTNLNLRATVYDLPSGKNGGSFCCCCFSL